MELKEAIEKARQILDEERVAPTVGYESTFADDLGPVLKATAKLLGSKDLATFRSQRPRRIRGDPREFQFKSTNYKLLCALLSQVDDPQRPQFIRQVLLERIQTSPACAATKAVTWPAWAGLTSDLPLVAELALRNGGNQQFFSILAQARPLPGHVLMLRQVQEMIQLNFTVVSEQEYLQLSASAANYGRTAAAQLRKDERTNTWSAKFPAIGLVAVLSILRELVSAADGIVEQCRQAGYLYLKGALLKGINLEINQDKVSVEQYLRTLGFSQPLVDCLNEAERLYLGPMNDFDLKSSMSHLRSFLESLVGEATGRLSQADDGQAVADGWGRRLVYLREKGVLSLTEEKFAATLYTLISDQAVHPLMAGQEYARLARNMVIEFALLFLRKLEKI